MALFSAAAACSMSEFAVAAETRAGDGEVVAAVAEAADGDAVLPPTSVGVRVCDRNRGDSAAELVVNADLALLASADGADPGATSDLATWRRRGDAGAADADAEVGAESNMSAAGESV